MLRDHLTHVGKEDLLLRFFNSIKEFSHQFLSGLTDLDHARAMAFVTIAMGASIESESSNKQFTIVGRKAGRGDRKPGQGRKRS